MHIHAWLSHGTTASFNGCNDQLIIEQKICPLLTGHLSLRNDRHQIEQQELSIVCDQVRNSFNNNLQFSQHRFALFDLKCFSFFAIQLQQNVMRQYQRFLQCLMVGMSGFGVFHQSWQNQFVTLRWSQFFLTQTKQQQKNGISKTYLGNFCTGLMSKLSSDSLPLCSRAIASRKRAKAGRAEDVERIASLARFQLFTNVAYVSSTVDLENYV